MRLWLGVWTFLATAAVLLVVTYVALLWTVSRFVSQLAATAIPGGVAYRIVRVTPWELELADIRLPGAKAPHAALLSLRFTPRRVVRGEVDAVSIVGLRLHASLGPDGMTMTSLPAGGGDSDWLLQLPARIDVQDAVVELATAEGGVSLPLSGSVVRQASVVRFHAAGNAGDVDAEATAVLTRLPGGTLDLQTQGRAMVPVAAAMKLWPTTMAGRPLLASGRLAMEWRGSTSLAASQASSTRASVGASSAGNSAVVPSLPISGDNSPSGTWQLLIRSDNVAAVWADPLDQGQLIHLRRLGGALTFGRTAGATSLSGELDAELLAPGQVSGMHRVQATLHGDARAMSLTAAVSGPNLAIMASRLDARQDEAGAWVLGGDAKASWTPEDRHLDTLLRGIGIELRDLKGLTGEIRFTYNGHWTAVVTDLRTGAGELQWHGPYAGQVSLTDVQLATQSLVLSWANDGPWTAVASGLALSGSLSSAVPGLELAGGASLTATADSAQVSGSGGRQLAVAVPRAVVTAACPELRLTHAGPFGLLHNDLLVARELQLRLPLDVHVEPGRIHLSLAESAELRWASLHAGAAGHGPSAGNSGPDVTAISENNAGESAANGVRVGPAAVSIAPEESSPLVHASAGRAAAAARFNLLSIHVVAQGFDFRAAQLALAARLSTHDAEPWTFDGRLGVRGLSVDHPGLGLGLHDIDLDLPLQGLPGATSASAPTEGRFSAGRVVYNGRELPGITGTVFSSPTALWAGVDWPLLTEGVVKASAALDWSGDLVTQLDIWLPEFDFTRAEDLRAFLPEALATADIRGRFSAKVSYYIDPETVVRWGEIEVRNGWLRSRELDAELVGVSGRVWTRSFDPLETPPGQTLSVERARLGRFEVRNGQVDFRLDPGDLIFVESARFGYAGGIVAARGFQVQPGRGAADLVLYADDLDIAQLAAQFSDGRVSGSGRVYARLPVSVVWPQRVDLGTGYIYAQASGIPGQAGTLRLTGYAQDIGRLVGMSMGGPTGDPTRDAAMQQVQRRVTDALVEFGFNSLTLDLLRAQDGPLTVTIRTNGRGLVTSLPPAAAPAAAARDRRRPPPASGPPSAQELDLTFNVTGLERLINAYLGLRQSGVGF